MVTTIQISNDLRRTLNLLKHRWGFRTIEETIRHYINGGVHNENNEQNKKPVDKILPEELS